MRFPPRESWACSGATTRNSEGPSQRTLTPSAPPDLAAACGQAAGRGGDPCPFLGAGVYADPGHGLEGALFQDHGSVDGACFQRCGQVRGGAAADVPESIDAFECC